MSLPLPPQAPDDMCQKLGTAPDTEMAVERGHILMRRRGAQTETRGDLLLAVTVEQARQRLPQPRRKLVQAGLQGADERAADESSELAMEEAEQPVLARGEFPLTLSAVQRKDADVPVSEIRYTDVS